MRDRYIQFVVSHFGYDYPVGGVVVGLTKYPDKKDVTFYFGPSYFRSEADMRELKHDIYSCVMRVIEDWKEPRYNNKILVPNDWIADVVVHDWVVIRRVYGWVVRNTRKRFIDELLRVNVPLHYRGGQYGLLSKSEIIKWVKEDWDHRLIYAKLVGEWSKIWEDGYVQGKKIGSVAGR